MAALVSHDPDRPAAAFQEISVIRQVCRDRAALQAIEDVPPERAATAQSKPLVKEFGDAGMVGRRDRPRADVGGGLWKLRIDHNRRAGLCAHAIDLYVFKQNHIGRFDVD
jgi:hypothetical protein